MAHDASGLHDRRGASPAPVVSFVQSLPNELGLWKSVGVRIPNIQPLANGYKSHLTVVSIKSDEARND